MYLTPDRFRTMGLGVDLTDVDDVTIRSAISRASARIDSVCAVPRLPQKFDFRGGRMVDESHVWVIDQLERPHPFQFWPWSTPVLVVEDFSIWSTNDIRVDIDPDNIFINNSAGYVELSSIQLTQFGIFGAGLVPLLGLYNPIAKMTYTYGHRFIVVDEEADPVDARTYQTQNQFWTADAVVVVKKGGAVQTTGFTIDRKEGYVVFDDNLPAESIVEVSYTYSLDSDIKEACGILVADDFGTSEMRERGMTGVQTLRVSSGGGASVEIARERRMSRAVSAWDSLPGEVQHLLSNHVFVTAR